MPSVAPTISDFQYQALNGFSSDAGRCPAERGYLTGREGSGISSRRLYEPIAPRIRSRNDAASLVESVMPKDSAMSRSSCSVGSSTGFRLAPRAGVRRQVRQLRCFEHWCGPVLSSRSRASRIFGSCRSPSWGTRRRPSESAGSYSPRSSPCKTLQLLERQLRTWLEFHPRDDLLAVLGVRHADDLRFGDDWPGVQKILDLAGIDVFSAANDDIPWPVR